MFTEKQLKQNIHNIMYSARKQAGMTQLDMANALGASQSNYSKMERGQLVPSAAEWALFCLTLDVPLNTITKGYLDKLQPAAHELKRPLGRFKIPKRYIEYPCCNIRYINPLLHFAQKLFGNEYTERLNFFSIDMDYFANFDNQINCQFLIDLTSYLHNESGKSMNQFFDEDFTSHYIHGDLHEKFKNDNNLPNLLKRYVTHSNKYNLTFIRKTEHDTSAKAAMVLIPQFTPNLLADPLAVTKNEETLLNYEKHFVHNLCRYAMEDINSIEVRLEDFGSKRTRFILELF
ncbi:MAG: helix-turn-helix domain-containing protein [Bacteriovoracia bacterium]